MFRKIYKLMQSTSVLIGGKQIQVGRKEWVPEAHFQKALQSQKFTKWVQGLNNEEVNIVSINVLLVYMFGNNVGFINVETEAYYENKRLPGFVFIRGDAVAILVLVNGKMILTRQYRVPVGRFLIEAPAGMLDEEKNFAGVAAKELKEECGLEITSEEMQHLGQMYVSPGGCDEVIQLFVVEKTISPESLNEILNKVHGSDHEGEHITLDIQDFTWSNVLKTNDSKLIACAAHYLARQGQPQQKL